MRTAFQISFFIAYLAALVWGGWYVLSGEMITDREPATGVEEASNAIVEETVDTDKATPPTEQP